MPRTKSKTATVRRARAGTGHIYKRGNIWWVKLNLDGVPCYESSESTEYDDAKNLLIQMQGRKASGTLTGGRADRVLIDELLDDVLDKDANPKLEESTRKVWTYVVKKSLRPFFGHIKAAKLTTGKMAEYRKLRTATVSDATANRELSVLRTAFHNGRKVTPPKVIQVPYFPMVKETTVREGFLDDEGYMRLRDQLPEYLRLVFVADWTYGIRKQELLSIQWPQVDFEEMQIRMPARNTKNREGRSLPIFPGDLEDMLRAAKKERDEKWPESPWVFNRQGAQIKNFRRAWDLAVDRAAIQTQDGRRLTVHDMRRTAVRNMSAAGVPQKVRMAISGHKTDSMERRYNIVDAADLKLAGALMAKRMKALAKASKKSKAGKGTSV